MVLVTNQNNNWELNETSTSINYNKILKTAGTFIDKDIEISVSSKAGAVSTPPTNITVTPTITYNSENNKFNISVSNTTNIVPTVTEGWVSEGVGGDITVSGGIEVAKTNVSASLINDSEAASGFSEYRIVASAGYNGEDLTSSINVYQGNYDL